MGKGGGEARWARSSLKKLKGMLGHFLLKLQMQM